MIYIDESPAVRVLVDIVPVVRPIPNASATARLLERMAADFRRQAIPDAPRARACHTCRTLLVLDEAHVCRPR